MRKVTALIADDVADMRALLRTRLHQYKCEVVKEVADGSQILAEVRKLQPDIVFLDINMPGMNGLQVLQELQAQQLHSYVWIVSAEDSPENIQQAMSLGAKGFIIKPFKLGKIKQVIDDFVEHRRAQKPLTVGIADDQGLMRDLLAETLRGFGTELLFAAEDGQQALQQLQAGPVPQMTFLDIEMPQLDGMQVLKQIKQQQIPTFVVIVSAHSSFDNVKQALDQGADAFIVKPYSDDKIAQVIEQCREAHRVQR